jgi:hypothetical protein
MTLSNEPVAWLPRDARLQRVEEAYGCFMREDKGGTRSPLKRKPEFACRRLLQPEASIL